LLIALKCYDQAVNGKSDMLHCVEMLLIHGTIG